MTSQTTTNVIVLRKRFDHLPPGFPGLTLEGALHHALAFLDYASDVVAEIQKRLDTCNGRVPAVSVRTALAVALANSLLGNLPHMTSIVSVAGQLDPERQRALGLRWRRPNGTEHVVTYRQVQYLLGRIAHAYPAAIDAPGYPHVRSVEDVANDLLGRLWTYLGIPESPDWALDSYVIPTHYRARSWGSMLDLDPESLPDQDPMRERTVATTATTRRKPQGGDTPRAAHWDAAERLRAEWLLHETADGRRDPASRKPLPVGPTMPGPFTRTDPDYPMVGPDLRARHTADPGAANGYVGAGRSRRAEIVNGRDKHALAACGILPDGSPIPPFARSFATAPAGNDKVQPALSAIIRAQRSGATVTTVRLDRIYTVSAAEALQNPARRLGVQLIKDLKQDQRRVRPVRPGVLLIDGFFFTAGTPTALYDIPRWAVNTPATERNALTWRFDQRAAYAFQRSQVLPSGAIQFRGPCYVSQATRDARERLDEYRSDRVTARCPNHPDFLSLPRHLPLTTCTKGVPCMCSRTFSIHPDDLPNNYEELIWGTSAWAEDYYRRNLVESFNAVDQYHLGLRRHSIRVQAARWDLMHMFHALAGLFLAFRNWMIRLGAPPDCDPLLPDVIGACLARTMQPKSRKGVNTT